MVARRFGRIVNITSGSVKMPLAGLDLSSGARAGLTGFLAGVARQVVHANVTINHLLPGAFDTDRIASFVAAAAQKTGRDPAEIRAEREQWHPRETARRAARIRRRLRLPLLGAGGLYHRPEPADRRRRLSGDTLSDGLSGLHRLARRRTRRAGPAHPRRHRPSSPAPAATPARNMRPPISPARCSSISRRSPIRTARCRTLAAGPPLRQPDARARPRQSRPHRRLRQQPDPHERPRLVHAAKLRRPPSRHPRRRPREMAGGGAPDRRRPASVKTRPLHAAAGERRGRRQGADPRTGATATPSPTPAPPRASSARTRSPAPASPPATSPARAASRKAPSSAPTTRSSPPANSAPCSPRRASTSPDPSSPPAAPASPPA